MIKEEIEPNKVNYFDISCPKFFKYLRYVGPQIKNSDVSVFEIYGIYESNQKSLKEDMLQPTNLPLLIINS